MSNFWQRTLSGAVYVAIVVGSILGHPIAFGCVFLLVTILATREFHQLVKSSKALTVESCLASGLLFSGVWAGLFCDMEWTDIFLFLAGFGYVGLLFYTLIAELFRKAENPIMNWGTYLQSQIMIALPFTLMNTILAIGPNWGYGGKILLALFILIWLNDSGAYCVGSLMAKRKGGNHKMFPRVSPGKSWEGLIGGAVVAIAASAGLAALGWFDSISHERISIYATSTLFALAVVCFGTLGDLMESLMKRTIGVKDSGRFMPGHGGVLDRFDSILLATPVIAILVLLLRIL